MAKQDPCCARRAAAIICEEGEVRRLARLIARQEERGRLTTSLRAQLAVAKTNLAEAKQGQVDHDAFHAADLPAEMVI